LVVATLVHPAGDARRGLLPWRRRITDAGRFDYTPFGGVRELIHEPLGLGAIPIVLLFPLWLPAAFVWLLGLVELVVALLVLPFALVSRSIRGAWPVHVFDSDGVLTRTETCHSWDAAGRRATEIREDLGQRWLASLPD
jgi:hypothetical protein